MAVPAEIIEWEYQMTQRTVLDEKVDHTQRDVADLKADVKRLDAKVDTKVDALSASLTEHRIETEKSFGKLRVEMRDYHWSQIVWLVGAVIAAVGAAFTIAKYFLP
jgi:hypothetical protein